MPAQANASGESELPKRRIDSAGFKRETIFSTGRMPGRDAEKLHYSIAGLHHAYQGQAALHNGSGNRLGCFQYISIHLNHLRSTYQHFENTRDVENTKGWVLLELKPLLWRAESCA